MILSIGNRLYGYGLLLDAMTFVNQCFFQLTGYIEFKIIIKTVKTNSVSLRGSIYNVKNNGPSTEPCSTLQ